MTKLTASTLFRIFGSCALLCALAPTACTDDPDCEEVLDGDFAIEVFYFGNVDCSDYSGRVIRKEDSGDVEQELHCEDEDGLCTCRGGDEFGSYDVYIEDAKTGRTEFAQFEVERRSAPQCISRENDGGFDIIDGGGGAGGNGGAGGSH